MANVNQLRTYGLFDAKVPRYTSYPPANRFQPDIGARMQRDWMAALPPDRPVSVYVHIPFCRRLCWFCACRTQGTSSLAPVAGYVGHLIRELQAARDVLPTGMSMARLHFGGGTPTLLEAPLLAALIDQIDAVFSRSADFEFSVEIDPTEAADPVLETLLEKGMRRASIGIQDFDERVQAAIGRPQSLAQTRRVFDVLRAGGIDSLNVDLLYGLPLQSGASLRQTLDQAITLGPDRLALYGYAHVPHMSKRQAMIKGSTLPGAERRYQMSAASHDRLVARGYVPCGIDHFARPDDSLAIAMRTGRMRRNFQGYTEDPCDTLLGFGASAISQFAQGYCQNAVATAAYNARIDAGGLAGAKGYVMTRQDEFLRDVIDELMCRNRIDLARLRSDYPERAHDIMRLVDDLRQGFPGAFEALQGDDRSQKIALKPDLGPITRLVAAHIDIASQETGLHSAAI